jgi:AcrR family transcriptional regulator
MFIEWGNDMDKNLKAAMLSSQLGQYIERPRKRATRESNEKDTSQLIIDVAERLFRQYGFQKTTVNDIARELHMSSANIYRFFVSKADIEQAVCMDLLGKIEAEAERIAASGETAGQKIRDLFGTVKNVHHEKYALDRKLYDLIEASIVHKWAVMERHTERMTAILVQIIDGGVESGEFLVSDATRAARLVNTACLRFRDPRLVVEYEPEPDPTLDQMIGFCLAAMRDGQQAKILDFPNPCSS